MFQMALNIDNIGSYKSRVSYHIATSSHRHIATLPYTRVYVLNEMNFDLWLEFDAFLVTFLITIIVNVYDYYMVLVMHTSLVFEKKKERKEVHDKINVEEAH